jgi:hypothetical protein
MVIARRLALILTFSMSLNGVSQERPSASRANHGVQNTWRVLGGPEQENGKPLEIATNSQTGVKLLLKDRRGTALLSHSPQSLPATVTFKLQSEFDPEASEPPTQLFGTGDFRIFIGESGHSPDDLGAYEGIQIRIFPHLGVSDNRRKTADESHTATSLWIRNIDSQRRTNSDGEQHTGLLSDACQNRSRLEQRHNCGWSRVLLTPGGFGLKNRETIIVSVVITTKHIEILAGGWNQKYDLRPSDLRISKIDSFAISHTNISRGYTSVTISDLAARPFEQPSETAR